VKSLVAPFEHSEGAVTVTVTVGARNLSLTSSREGDSEGQSRCGPKGTLNWTVSVKRTPVVYVLTQFSKSDLVAIIFHYLFTKHV
jgi:hypothetical protein